MSLFGEHLADDQFVGWGMYGEVDRIEHESIVTRFFCFVVPLWPSYSVYLTKSPDGEQRYIKIETQPRSVALGYLRFDLWLAAVVLGTAGIVDRERFGVLLYIGLALAALAALLQFAVGRLDPVEYERRTMLRRVSGLGAPPELLPERLLVQVRNELLDAWYSQSHQPWQEAIANGAANELLVALADYHHRPSLVERARGNLAVSSDDHLRWN